MKMRVAVAALLGAACFAAQAAPALAPDDSNRARASHTGRGHAFGEPSVRDDGQAGQL